jgi:Zn/Cd-binding protein ZinT
LIYLTLGNFTSEKIRPSYAFNRTTDFEFEIKSLTNRVPQYITFEDFEVSNKNVNYTVIYNISSSNSSLVETSSAMIIQEE